MVRQLHKRLYCAVDSIRWTEVQMLTHSQQKNESMVGLIDMCNAAPYPLTAETLLEQLVNGFGWPGAPLCTWGLSTLEGKMKRKLHRIVKTDNYYR